MTTLLIILLAVVVAAVIVCLVFIGKKTDNVDLDEFGSTKQTKQPTMPKRHTAKNMKAASNTIYIGMSKEDVLMMVGPRFNKSILKSGEEKYSWKIQGGGTSIGFKGSGIRSYYRTPTLSLTVYFIDNKVSRFDSNNL